VHRKKSFDPVPVAILCSSVPAHVVEVHALRHRRWAEELDKQTGGLARRQVPLLRRNSMAFTWPKWWICLCSWERPQ
jgi:hypothetical protein